MSPPWRGAAIAPAWHSKANQNSAVATSLLDWTIIRPPRRVRPREDVFEMFRMANCRPLALDRGFTSMIWRGCWLLCYPRMEAYATARASLRPSDAGEPGGWTHEGFARAIGWALGKRINTFSAPRALLFAAAWADRSSRQKRKADTRSRRLYEPS